MIRSRVSDATSVVWSLVGSMLGASIVGRSRAAGSQRWLGPAMVLWFMIAMLEAWTPPKFAWPEPPVLRPDRLVPFLAYYRRTDIYALADLISQTMFFVPLGALLAARFPRISMWAFVGIGLILGIVLEAGQLFLVDRTSEITDALSAAFGAGLGSWLWRRGESIRDPSRGVARYRVRAHIGFADPPG
jgi:glycopeptide antibiotics resistance protein